VVVGCLPWYKLLRFLFGGPTVFKDFVPGLSERVFHHTFWKLPRNVHQQCTVDPVNKQSKQNGTPPQAYLNMGKPSTSWYRNKSFLAALFGYKQNSCMNRKKELLGDLPCFWTGHRAQPPFPIVTITQQPDLIVCGQALKRQYWQSRSLHLSHSIVLLNCSFSCFSLSVNIFDFRIFWWLWSASSCLLTLNTARVNAAYIISVSMALGPSINSRPPTVSWESKGGPPSPMLHHTRKSRNGWPY